MKTKQLLLSIILLIAAQTAVNAQNTITDVDSIPILAYLYSLDGVNPNLVNEIDSLRFHSVEVLNLRENQYEPYLENHNFMVIPDQVSELHVGPGKNLIIKYTEAKYSVWQAEGTPPNDGEATIVANPTYTAKDNSGKFIFTKDSDQIPYGTELINGPSYIQDARYNSADTGKVDYRADFRMKLKELIPGITLATDTVCNLQITTSIYDVINNEWVRTAYLIIEDKPVLFGDFTELEEWLSFYVDYDLYELPDHFYNNYSRPLPIPEPDPGHWRDYSRNHIQHIEFKIIWKGDAQVIKLFVDSITISDERGRSLCELPSALNTAQDIVEMIQYNYPYKHKISGWFGLDEPHSIDNFEPIRIISELLTHYFKDKSRLASYDNNKTK